MLTALLLGVGFAGNAGAGGDPADLPELTLGAPRWERVAAGIEFARVEARQFVAEGSPGIAVIRADPARCRVEPFHESETGDAAPLTVDGWLDYLDAPVVLNAGLYDEDRAHLGVLRRDGAERGRFHATWKGLLVWGEDPPAGHVLDLADAPGNPAPASYANAVQSMMLLDAAGRPRVRRSERIAPRTLVAETEDGHLLFLVTEGSYTLWNTARLLAGSGWAIVRAMALDGGSEANLAVRGASVDYRSAAGVGAPVSRGPLRAVATLPAVIALRPRDDAGR